MQRPFLRGSPENKAARAVFIIWIFFDNFTSENGVGYFVIIDVPFRHLPDRVVGEKYLSTPNQLPDKQNIHKILFQ